MKKIGLVQSITLLANISVIVGIVFLAVEINQNNDLLESQARTSRLEVLKESTVARIDSPELRLAYRKVRTGEILTPDEDELVRLYLFNVFSNWHYTYQEYKAGLLDERELRTDGWRAVFELGPNSADLWAGMSGAFDPEFVSWFEQNVIRE